MKTSIQNQQTLGTTTKANIPSLEHSHSKAGVKQYSCSDFTASLNLLAEGEFENPQSGSRNAKVTFTDLNRLEHKGDFELIILLHILMAFLRIPLILKAV